LQIPAFGVSPLFATVLPVGFAGGHGTAGGLTPTYKAVSYHDEIINFIIHQMFALVCNWSKHIM